MRVPPWVSVGNLAKVRVLWQPLALPLVWLHQMFSLSLLLQTDVNHFLICRTVKNLTHVPSGPCTPTSAIIRNPVTFFLPCQQYTCTFLSSATSEPLGSGHNLRKILSGMDGAKRAHNNGNGKWLIGDGINLLIRATDQQSMGSN